MTAWRYEISLLVLKNISLVRCAHSRNIFQHSKRNFVSPRGHVIYSIFLEWEFEWSNESADRLTSMGQAGDFLEDGVSQLFKHLYGFGGRHLKIRETFVWIWFQGPQLSCYS